MTTPRQPPAGPSDAPAAPAARSPEAEDAAKLVYVDLVDMNWPPRWPEDYQTILGALRAAESRGKALAEFGPLGDNHHNAAACPYCGDLLSKAESRGAKAAREEAAGGKLSTLDLEVRRTSFRFSKETGNSKRRRLYLSLGGKDGDPKGFGKALGRTFQHRDRVTLILTRDLEEIHRIASGEPRAAPTPALPREAPEPGGALTGPCQCDNRVHQGRHCAGDDQPLRDCVWCGAMLCTLCYDGHACEKERQRRAASDPLRAAPSDSAPATPGLGTQEGLEASAAPPRSPTGDTLGEVYLLRYWLLRAYKGRLRQGWEEGPTEAETFDGVLSVLCNIGLDPFDKRSGAEAVLAGPEWYAPGTASREPRVAPPSPDSPSQGERKQQPNQKAGEAPAPPWALAIDGVWTPLGLALGTNCGHANRYAGNPSEWPIHCCVGCAGRAIHAAFTSDKPAAGPSSPSSASLESGGGTLDTMGAANPGTSSGEER